MQRHSLDDKHLSDFQRIYLAAKELDNEALAALMQQEVCIDVLDEQGLFTPAGKIASEGKLTPKKQTTEQDKAVAERNVRALKLLLSFRAHPDSIGAGAAYAGEFEYAEYCRNELGADVSQIAAGAARVNSKDHYAYALWLHKERGASRASIIFGMAMNGDITQAELMAETVSEKESLISGAALGGYSEFILQFCQQPNAADYIKCAIAVTLQAGNMALFAELNNLYPNSFDLTLCSRMAGLTKNLGVSPKINIFFNDDFSYGLALGGHFKALKQSEVSWRLLCAMLRGQHVEDARLRRTLGTLRETALNFSVVRYLVTQGRLSPAVELYNQHIILYLPIMYNIIHGLSRGPCYQSYESALHQLSFIDNHAFLTKLAETITGFNKSGNQMQVASTPEQLHYVHELFSKRKFFLSDIEKLVKTAIKINRLMREYHFTYDQAYAFALNPLLRKFLLLLPTALKPSTINQVPLDGIYLVIGGLGNLSYESARGIYHTFSFVKLKQLFVSKLGTYASTSYLGRLGSMFSGVYHTERAVSLIAAVRLERSKESYKVLLRQQRDLFNGIIQFKADINQPKYLQPLNNSNPTKDAYFDLVVEHEVKATNSDMSQGAEKPQPAPVMKR